MVNMVDQKKIDRINELARKNKAEGLTPEEIKEYRGTLTEPGKKK